jgi:hypothetical protein
VPETRLEFNPLTFIPERDGILVGSPLTKSYAIMPADGAELLRRLTAGTSVDEAARWYGTTFGESVDMTDFLATLHDLGFIKAAGETPAEPRRIPFKRLGRAAFSPLAWVCYGGVFAGCAIAMTRNPQLRPHPASVFFTQSLIVVQLVLFVAQMPALLWHEWFHVLAGRRLGLPTRLGVSRRLIFFVFETRLDGLLSVPRRRRYLPFLAGMLADAIAFSALTLAALGLHGGLAWAGRLALAIAFTTLLRLAWQLFLFLRTDPYYALTTALGCTNLAEASSAYLRDRIRRIRPPRNPSRNPSRNPTWNPSRNTGAESESWTPRDAAVAPWFALLTVVEAGILLWLVTFAVVPVLTQFTVRLLAGLTHGTVDGPRFWDSTVSLLVVILQIVVLPLLAARYARRRPDQAPPDQAPPDQPRMKEMKEELS